MDKAIWKGIVSFDNVNIPVKLYTAVRNERVQFHLLHDKDLVRLRQEFVCSEDGAVVEHEHRVKGFETSKDHYVVIDDDELKSLVVEADRSIHVHEFVGLTEMDPRYFSHPWILGPGGEGSGLAALVGALQKSGLCGICEWTMRGESYLGALITSAGAPVLISLKHGDEIIPVESLKPKEVKLDKREIEIAQYLIDQLFTEFVYAEYKDEYQDKLRELIARKAKGEKIKTVKVKTQEATGSGELLAALEKSVKMSRRIAHA